MNFLAKSQIGASLAYEPISDRFSKLFLYSNLVYLIYDLWFAVGTFLGAAQTGSISKKPFSKQRSSYLNQKVNPSSEDHTSQFGAL